MVRTKGSKLVAWWVAASLATPVGALAAEPVPVQRPGEATAPVIESAVEPVAEPVAEPDVEPIEPAVDTTSSDVLPDAAVAVPRARISGVVLDTEQAGVGVPDATITASCPCMSEPIVMHSDYDGRFSLDDLPAGTYTLRLDRGGRHSERIVSIGAGQKVRIAVKVAPPTETKELERRDKIERRTAIMIATGSIAALGGLFMIIAGGIEANKPPCMFGLDDCSNAPRPAVAKGMGIGGALALAGGAALVVSGVVSRRRLRAAVAADTTGVGVTIRGRF